MHLTGTKKLNFLTTFHLTTKGENIGISSMTLTLIKQLLMSNVPDLHVFSYPTVCSSFMMIEFE